MTRHRARSPWTRLARYRARLSTLYGVNRRNVDLVYAHNARSDYPLADDKGMCKAHLEHHGVPVAETLAVCSSLFEVDAVVAQLRAQSDFVVKPANGSGGEGILVLGERTAHGFRSARGDEVSERALRTHLANIVFGAHSRSLEDTALVERRVRPQRFFASLWADGVCDLRVLTLRGRPLLAMLRVPTRRSGGRANLHQGAIGVAVELESGRTTAAYLGGRPVSAHPETGAVLLDRMLPMWRETLAVARRAARCMPLGYLGIDLVLDAARGPLVLEVNVRPGLEIQNVTGVPLGAVVEERAP